MTDFNQPLDKYAKAQRIVTDEQAIEAAKQVAAFALVKRDERDQQRQLPFAVMDLFSQTGLGGIRIPKQYGGAEVSNRTLADIFRILSKADANIGLIPQNQISFFDLSNVLWSWFIVMNLRSCLGNRFHLCHITSNILGDVFNNGKGRYHVHFFGWGNR